MNVTLSVVKADVGGYEGHSGSQPQILAGTQEYLESDRKAGPEAVFMAGNAAFGARNLPCYRSLACPPIDTIGVAIAQNVHTGVHPGSVSRVHDKTSAGGRNKARAQTEFVLREPTYDDLKQVFVAIPFTKRFDGVYAEIGAVAKALGLECCRADSVFGGGALMDKIWELIRSAVVVIADITEHNPNVYYELGIAHGLGKETILLWADDGNDIPSDLRHLEYIRYENLIGGSRNLKRRLWIALEKVMKSIVS